MQTDYIEITDTTQLYRYKDKKIVVKGRISNVPWQHMIGDVQTHPQIYYFDIKDYQIVIYTKKQINTYNEIKVWGTVYKVEGRGKRPGSEQIYTEYHIIVDKWEIL